MTDNLNVGSCYYPSTFKQAGYTEVARFSLDRQHILGWSDKEAIRYDKGNEICLVVEEKGLLKVIEYLNFETGKHRRLIRRK
jgi:hypothetical protein